MRFGVCGCKPSQCDDSYVISGNFSFSLCLGDERRNDDGEEKELITICNPKNFPLHRRVFFAFLHPALEVLCVFAMGENGKEVNDFSGETT